METVDSGIPGKYRQLNNGTAEQTMDARAYQKSLTSGEEGNSLNRKHSSDNRTKCRENAAYHFQSFAENASIDGIKFVGEKGRTILERVFWTITLTVALVLCAILVLQTFKKWINSPVIVTFATSQTPIFEIPFPAITICPEVKSNRFILNYTEVYLKKANNETMDKFEENGFNYLSLICDPESELLDEGEVLADPEVVKYLHLLTNYLTWSNINQFERNADLTEFANSNNLSLRFQVLPDDFLNVTCSKFAPELNESLLEIKWKGHEFDNNGTGLFTTTLTEAGVCYTFNAFDRKELFTDIVSYEEGFFSTGGLRSDWFPESGYVKDGDNDAYPRRTMVAGAKGGLSLILMVLDFNLDYACGDSLQGFKVSLHHPGQFPRVNHNFFRMPLEETVVASVKPNMMTTSEALRNYKPKERQCYFVSEKNLKFFKIYNQQNCLVECLANFTLKYCECVGFHMPRKAGTPICGTASLECLEVAEVLFLADKVDYKIKQSTKSKLRKDLNLEDVVYNDKCDCLPACISLDYDVEISQSNWNWPDAYNVLKQTKSWDQSLNEFFENSSFHLARLQIYFKDMQFITSQRNELYGYADFWANIGGIIGLFTGFSFITMFEIFYYLSLRLFCNVKLFGRRNWSGAPELLEETKTASERNKGV